MRIRNVEEPHELGFKENGMYHGKRINRDDEGDIHNGWNPNYWREENKSLYEMTPDEIDRTKIKYMLEF